MINIHTIGTKATIAPTTKDIIGVAADENAVRIDAVLAIYCSSVLFVNSMFKYAIKTDAIIPKNADVKTIYIFKNKKTKKQ